MFNADAVIAKIATTYGSFTTSQIAVAMALATAAGAEVIDVIHYREDAMLQIEVCINLPSGEIGFFGPRWVRDLGAWRLMGIAYTGEAGNQIETRDALGAPDLA